MQSKRRRPDDGFRRRDRSAARKPGGFRLTPSDENPSWRSRGEFEDVGFVIKNGPHLKQAREALGWTPVQLARALRLSGGDKQGEKRVLEMEAGKREISGPVTVAVESFLHGYLPVGYKPHEALAESEAPQA
jgi:hypothetical protein